MPIDMVCKIFDDFILGKTTSLNHSTYNICSSNSLSIMDVAKKIQSFCLQEFNFRPPIITMKAPNKELFSSFTIKSKLQSLSKYNFERIFNQELLSLLKYCDQNKVTNASSYHQNTRTKLILKHTLRRACSRLCRPMDPPSSGQCGPRHFPVALSM